MACFQGKIRWKRQRKREIKIIVPFRSYPTRNIKLQKNSKKIKRIPFWLLFKPNLDGKGRERKKIKINVPLRYYLMGYRKFQKNSKQIKKYHYRIISSQIRLEKAEKERK